MPDRKNRKARRQSESARVPNKETLEALREAREGKNLETYDSLEEFIASFD